MRARRFVRLFIAFAVLAGCESTTHQPPPVTAQMAKTGPAKQVSLATLQKGRTLFVSRCIECHILPAVSSHTAAQWPRVVDEMAERSSLKEPERNALLAYLLAARSQM